MKPFPLNRKSRWFAFWGGVGELLRWLWGRPLWLRSAISPREHERRRVRRELEASIAKADGFIQNKRKMLDLDVLEWDFGVRSLLRQYLGPEALGGFARATLLDLNDAGNAAKSADALRRAKDSLRATIAAMTARTGIFIGGFTRAWLYRAVIQGGIAVVSVVLGAGLIWVLGFQGDGLSKQTIIADGVEKDIVKDRGDAVEVAPTSTTGPPNNRI